MSYLSDRKQKRNKKLWYALAFVLLLSFLFFFRPIALFVTPVTYTLSSYLYLLTSFVEERKINLAGYFTSKRELESVIEELEKENDTLYNEIAFKNEQLATYLQDTGDTSPHRIEVQPHFTLLADLYDSFMINAGFASGLEKGMVVYAKGYEAIGVIEEVYADEAKVILISKYGNELEGVVGTSTLSLRLHGIGGGDFVIDAPKNVTVHEGQELFWREKKGMRVGSVALVEDTPQSIGKRIFVRGAFTPGVAERLYVDLP
jgi:cell shape-determining protein MreC